MPDATYGDAEIDLSQYAPEGSNATYTSSDSEVVQIDGSTMRIKGAGTAMISASLPDGENSAEVVHSMRKFNVNKADLSVTVADIVIEVGDEIPDFTYLAEGLKYDDTLDDIEALPQPVHDVDENTPVGEYEVTFTEGHDRNYNITTVPAKIIVSDYSGTDNLPSDAVDVDIEVYDLNGILVYTGKRTEAKLTKGVYIVRQGKITRKVMVK